MTAMNTVNLKIPLSHITTAGLTITASLSARQFSVLKGMIAAGEADFFLSVGVRSDAYRPPRVL